MTNDNGVIGDVLDKQSVLANRVPSGMERAEIESAIATAKKYPREIKKFQQNLLAMATLDRETAAACFYSVPRAGKRIEGPSIRLAEMAAICFGNIAVDGDIVGEDGECVYAIGTCRDLENNVLFRQKVGSRILDKNGKRYNSDMINTTQAATVSKAIRNAITRVVPRSIINPILEKCKEVAVGKAQDFNKRRTQVINGLVKMGVDVNDILDSLNRSSVEDIDGKDLLHLIGLGTAIHDGNQSVENAFPKSETPADALDVEPLGGAAQERVDQLKDLAEQEKTPKDKKGKQKKTAKKKAAKKKPDEDKSGKKKSNLFK